MNPLLARLAHQRRRLLVARATRRDTTPPPPEAFAAYGDGSWIVPPARITEPERIEIGSRVVIHEHAWLSVVTSFPDAPPRLVIGDRVRLGRFAHIACVGDVTVEDDVLTADGIFIGDTYHAYEDTALPIRAQPMAKPSPVRICRGAFLGIRSTVLHGVTIGENAYVGAGAVVTKDVAPRTVVVGNPARPVRRWDDSTRTWLSV